MAMIFENVKSFATESQDLYKAMKEYTRNYILNRKESNRTMAFQALSKEDMETLINKEFTIELERRAGKSTEYGVGQDGVRRWCNASRTREFANAIQDVVIDMILPDVLATGMLPLISDIKTAELGDSIKFQIKNSQLFTVSKAGYRQKATNLQRLFNSDVSMVGENHEVTIGANLFDITTGKYSFAENTVKVALSIEATMYNEAVDAFYTSANALSGNLAVANYTETSLMKLCETVTAWNGGRKAVIVGTPVALKSVLPTNNNFRYSLEDAYIKLGSIQQFNGYDVIPMEQVAKLGSTTYELKLDDTKIYVVSPASDKIVKIGLFGGTVTHADGSYDNANKTISNTTEKAWNVAVVTNSVAGVVSSLS